MANKNINFLSSFSIHFLKVKFLFRATIVRKFRLAFLYLTIQLTLNRFEQASDTRAPAANATCRSADATNIEI